MSPLPQNFIVTIWFSGHRASKTLLMLNIFDSQIILGQIQRQPILLAFDIDDHTFVILNHQVFGAFNKSQSGRIGLVVFSSQVIEVFEMVDVAFDRSFSRPTANLSKPFTLNR